MAQKGVCLDPKKILIIRFSSLGDIVLATSVIAPLKKKFPEAELSFLTKREYIEVLEGNPNLAAVIGLSKEELKLVNFTKLAEGFYGNYDLIIDLHANLRSFLIRAYSGIETKIYRKAALRRRRMVGHAFTRGLFPFLPEVYKKEENVRENYFKALEPLGVNYKEELPEIVMPEIKNKAAFPLIGLHAGGKQNTKRWPAEKFAEVADYYAGKAFKVILLGDEKDTYTNSKIMALVKNKQNLADLSGKTTFREMALKIKECSVLVTNDSAPFHIATAVKTPVVVIFCATTPKFGFAVRAKTNRIVNIELPCKPCSLHGGKNCPKGHFRCAGKIDPRDVIKQVNELI